MQLIQELNNIINERHLLTHPFYIAWSKGELSQEILKKYASQYYHQVQSFPRFISAVHSACPNIKLRKILLENLIDEELHGTDHPTLWRQFATGLGVPEETLLNESPISETQYLVETYFELAKNDQNGLCALYAYEFQVPAVSISKIQGLKDFYGIEDEKTLQFFTAHQIYDVDHAKKVAELIEEYVDPAQAKRATLLARDVQWHFLDGMCRVGNIHC